MKYTVVGQARNYARGSYRNYRRFYQSCGFLNMICISILLISLIVMLHRRI